MRYTVYGLRLRGDREIRYVGVTGKDAECRFRKHMYPSSLQVGTPLGRWLLCNKPNIEILDLASASNRSDAFETERALIALFVRVGHRLLNHMHVLPHPRTRRAA